MHTNGAIRVALGNTCLGIRCRDRGFMDAMKTGYAPFLVEQRPDFWIEFSFRHSLSVDEINELVGNLHVSCDGERYVTEPELLDCRLEHAKATIRVDTQRNVFSPGVSYKLMNHLMRGLYYGIYRWGRHSAPDAHLVHGCGVLSDGRGYLFVGPSGAGKTTVARHSQGRLVLNDEAVLVGQNESGFYVAGTPFDGGVPGRSPVAARLSAILCLKQDRQVSLRRMSGSETYPRLLKQVLEACPLFDISGESSLPQRADISAALARSVPAYELSFLPDASFWEPVDNLFGGRQT